MSSKVEFRWTGYSASIPYSLILIGLTLIACLSPLLTFARLWQIKEWRWDRLREHRKEDGCCATFVSTNRVLLILPWLLVFFIIMLHGSEELGEWALHRWHFVLLGMLAALSIIQVLMRRQPTPVWTQKALMIFGLSVFIDLAVIVSGSMIPLETRDSPGTLYIIYPLDDLASVMLPYLQPLIVALAWTLLLPVDRVLKRRILNKAAALRSIHPDLHVIGITGSVGKTTTKELIAHVLKDIGHGTLDGRSPGANVKNLTSNILVTPEHVNTEMGVAAWLTQKLQTTSYKLQAIAIVEMGAYRKGEIATLCRITKPQWGVLTHIGTQHVGLFGSPETLRDAKAELIESLPADGHAFLNGDNAGCREIAKRALCPVTLVGTGGHLDLEAFDIEETGTGIRFHCEDVAFDVPLHGTHNVTNVLLAIAIGKKSGMTVPAIAAALRTFTPPSKTFVVRTARGVVILDDTHNASESSIAAAIAWAKTRSETHKILVTPGLIEMGTMSKDAHERLGKLATASFDDVVFMNTKNAQHFARGYGKNVTILSKQTPRVSAGTLLVCVGRMPASVIEQLLPRE